MEITIDYKIILSNISKWLDSYKHGYENNIS